MKSKRLAFMVIFALLPNSPVALAKNSRASASAPRLLIFPTEARSLETADVGISGIFVDQDRLFLVASGRPHVLVTPFHGLKPTRQETFGPIIASTRHAITDQTPQTEWRGVSRQGARILLLDGQGLRLLALSAVDFSLVARRSIAWDLIKPAADPKGEPTKIETDQLRVQFRREFLKAGEVKLAGMALYRSDKVSRYLLATRLKEFPVVMMSCSGEDGSMCYLERACRTPSVSNLSPSSIAGIAYSKKRNMLLLGDRASNRILQFKFGSCYSMTQQRSLEVPPKIKSLSNLFVDEADRLWVVSNSADDYLNASAYVWESAQW